MKKKVLVLGGGLLQVPLIKKAKEKGFEVFLSDYFQNPPGKQYCDGFRQISSVSVEDNYRYALEEKVDYIMTIGTDQPVYTAAVVSARLNLPHPISERQALLVTNKCYMKQKMTQNDIPTPGFNIYLSPENVPFGELNYPAVLKPADSQGQRGIHVLKGTEGYPEVKALFDAARRHSPTGTVIIEDFYPGGEITVNTWVKDGKAFNLMITDRLHFDDTIALGLCKQQRFPSKAAVSCMDQLERIVQRLVSVFEIRDGPLYIQMIIGHEGPKIIEFGYRIGGGFESETIPRVTGVDILELYLALVTGGKNLFQPEKAEKKAAMGSMFFLFAKPGTATKIVLPAGFGDYGRLFIKEKDEIGEIENATSRVGCFAFYTDNPREYIDFVKKFDAGMAIYNRDNNDLLIHGIWE